ncbi:MAG: hypothetical protein WCF67_12295, partial [Chitinophagaceae bacterium]
MYLIQSSDGGNTFGQAQKLGKRSWALDGCPMDGGGVAINSNGNSATVWRRKSAIYACEPGKDEKQLGEGKSCTITSVNDKNVYAWVEDGHIVVLKPNGMKEQLGKGQQPVIKAINATHVLCVWEYEKQIHKAIVAI